MNPSFNDLILQGDPDIQIALKDAQETPVTVYRMVSSDVAEAYFAKINKRFELEDRAAMRDGIIAALCKATIKTLDKSGGEFNIDPNHPIGQGNRESLSVLVQAGVFTQQEADDFLALGTLVVYPYADKTLHDALIVRDEVPLVDVSDVNGFAVIETNAEAPLHNPRLLALNPRTQKLQRINNFRMVKEAGKYDCKIPAEWRGADLKVDNPYGVI